MLLILDFLMAFAEPSSLPCIRRRNQGFSIADRAAALAALGKGSEGPCQERVGMVGIPARLARGGLVSIQAL